MTNNTKRDRRIRSIKINYCENCGRNDYNFLLTVHHIFKKRDFIKQPQFDRKYRYAILCYNCHVLVENNIMNDKFKEILINRLLECEKVYGKLDFVDKELFKLSYCKGDKK
jgi:hypothetical protein